MYLTIDLSEKDIIDLTLFNDTDVFEKQFDGSNRELLNNAAAFLQEHNVKKEDIQGIAVVVGEGSFTSTRIAVTMANTFAYALKIPLITIKKEQKDKRQELIDQLEKKAKGEYISATYSGEPNIGKKKSE